MKQEVKKLLILNLPYLLYGWRNDNRNPFDGSIKGRYNLNCLFNGYISLTLWKK